MIAPIITVVVPVYNIEKCIDRCVNSILAQSFQNFELLLVDDGCTDSSGTICDHYAEKDSRVKVFHKPNGGVSSARNKGIEEAHGEYICFIDSDDWVDNDYLKIYMDANPEKYDVVLQSFFFEYENTGLCIPQILPEKEILKASELEFFLEYTDGVHNGFLWHRLFHTNVIKKYNIRFPENVSYAEDGIFFLNYISKVSTCYITDRAGYHYFIRKNSLTGQGKKLSKDIYTFLLDNYIKWTTEIFENDKPDKRVLDGLKLYLWRLAHEWLFERSMNNYNDYKDIINYLAHYSIIYHDRTIRVGSICFAQIMRITRCNTSYLRYIELSIMLKIYSIKKRIFSKIKDIRKRIKKYNGV